MKKFFCVSDIHSFYDELVLALSTAGYNQNNPDHILVVLGDIFDRGPDPIKIYNFLRSIPKAQRILIRGNHEFLLRDMIKRRRTEGHDITNGTADTVGIFVESVWGTEDEYWEKYHKDYPNYFIEFEKLGILDWIFSDEWVNYFETKKYICVHSWIPVDTHTSTPLVFLNNYNGFTFKKDWRKASLSQWEDATWGFPFLMKQHGLSPGKTMIVGHVNTKYFRVYLDGESKKTATAETYIGDGIIALDSCIKSSGFCNVFVFEE